MSIRSLGATPAVLISTLAIATLAVTSVGIGVSLTPPQKTVAPTLDYDDAVAVDASQNVSIPARVFIEITLGSDVSWGRKIPTRFGCAAPTAVYTATNKSGEGLHVFTAGQASEPFNTLRSCGTQSTVAGQAAVLFSTSGGSVALWQRGDVILSYSGPSKDFSKNAEALDERAVANLSSVCHDLTPSVEDATRSPLHAKYAPYTQTRTFSTDLAQPPEAKDILRDVGLSQKFAKKVELGTPLTEAVTLTSRALPERLQGPLLPETTLTQPTPPSAPPQRPEHASLTREAPDTKGPGCGWSFTQTVPPIQDVQGLSVAFEQAIEAHKESLAVDEDQWRSRVASYYVEAANYLIDASAWNDHARAVEEVYSSWDLQTKALEAYDKSVAEREAALVVANQWDADWSASRSAFDAQVAYCTALPEVLEPEPEPEPEPDPVSPTPTQAPAEPAPTSTSTPAEPAPAPAEANKSLSERVVGCPAREPAILSQKRPSVPDEPLPPVLWEPDVDTQKENL